MDIAQRVQQLHARHVVVAITATTHPHLTLIPTRRPIQQEAVQVSEVVAPLEVLNLAGHEQARQFFIHPLRCRLSRLFGAQ